MRKLCLWRTFSITDPSKNMSVFWSPFRSSWSLELACSEESLFVSDLSCIRSRCSWSRLSTLLCKLNGITTCTCRHNLFQMSNNQQLIVLNLPLINQNQNFYLPLRSLIIKIWPIVGQRIFACNNHLPIYFTKEYLRRTTKIKTQAHAKIK